METIEQLISRLVPIDKDSRLTVEQRAQSIRDLDTIIEEKGPDFEILDKGPFRKAKEIRDNIFGRLNHLDPVTGKPTSSR